MASAGEILACRDRWLDAVASGEPPAALVDATLRGCREAAADLGARLSGRGYPVSTFLLPAPPDLPERVAWVEAHTGVPLPKVVVGFWRAVGGISLVDLQQYRQVGFWEERAISGARQYGDGVHVDRCDDAWLEYTLAEFNDYAGDGEEEDFRYIFSPDGYHKDDTSGGSPYALGRGSDWAPLLEEFTWSGYRQPDTAPPGPPDFVSYLRTALLECAGFPGFLGHPRFEAARRDLVRDLRPF